MARGCGCQAWIGTNNFAKELVGDEPCRVLLFDMLFCHCPVSFLCFWCDAFIMSVSCAWQCVVVHVYISFASMSSAQVCIVQTLPADQLALPLGSS